MATIDLDANWQNPILENCFTAHDGPVTSISFNDTGEQLATTGKDGVLKIWNFKRYLRSYVFKHLEGPITNVRFSKNGLLVASVAGSTVSIRTPEMHSSTWSFRPHVLTTRCIDFSIDDHKLLTCSDDKTVKIWSIENASCRFLHSLIGHQNWVRWARFSPDGRTLASCGDDGQIIFWDLENRCRIGTCNSPNRDSFLCLEFHANGVNLTSSTAGRFVHVWDIRNRGVTQAYRDHTASINTVDIHPEGQFVCSGSMDGTAKLYNLMQQKLFYTLHGHKGPVNAVQFSKDGNFLCSASDKGTVFLWRTNFARPADINNTIFTSESNANQDAKKDVNPMYFNSTSAVSLPKATTSSSGPEKQKKGVLKSILKKSDGKENFQRSQLKNSLAFDCSNKR